MEEFYTQRIAWYTFFETVGKICVSAPKRVTRYLWVALTSGKNLRQIVISDWRGVSISRMLNFQSHFSIFKPKTSYSFNIQDMDILQIGMYNIISDSVEPTVRRMYI